MSPDPRFEPGLATTRRHFLGSAGLGIGAAALAGLLERSARAADPAAAGSGIGGLPGLPHFAPRAKRVIYLMQNGAPAHVDLFDPKPKLNELNGQALPESMTKNVRFAFIKKETAKLLGSPRVFKKHGQSGMDFSDLVPHLASCADDLLIDRKSVV